MDQRQPIVPVEMARCTRRRVVTRAAGAAGVGAAAVALGACGAAGAGPQRAAPPPGCTERMEIWSAFGAGTVQGEAMVRLAADFGAGKSGCAVEVVVAPTDLVPKLTAAISAGAPPASATLAPAQVTSWSATGLLQALDDLFKRDRLREEDFPAPLWQNMNFTGRPWFLPL